MSTARRPATALVLDLQARVQQCRHELRASDKRPDAASRASVPNVEAWLRAIEAMDNAVATLGELASATEGWPVRSVGEGG
jgi:hypothetical protein